MSAQLWAAVGFTLLLVVFLMVTFFIKDTSSDTQFKTLKFLTSLCGGIAGTFFVGEALFSYAKDLDDGAKLTLSGTAGFAVFFLVWLTYGKRTENNSTTNIKMSFPEGWTFEQCARAIGQSRNTPVAFQSFSQEELNLACPQMDINAENMQQALLQIMHHTRRNLSYSVALSNGIYILEKS